MTMRGTVGIIHSSNLRFSIVVGIPIGKPPNSLGSCTCELNSGSPSWNFPYTPSLRTSSHRKTVILERNATEQDKPASPPGIIRWQGYRSYGREYYLGRAGVSAILGFTGTVACTTGENPGHAVVRHRD